MTYPLMAPAQAKARIEREPTFAAASPSLLANPTHVGSGLVFAGPSGWNGMTSLLAITPWNRASA